MAQVDTYRIAERYSDVGDVRRRFFAASEMARETINMRRTLNAAASTVRWWLHGEPGQFGAHGDDIIINHEITITYRNRINEPL